ncbi:MAG TPA: MBL fold metallo-hydrolase [Thermodesulfobacteriota bacterium]|nr:MBL fold metallo-hydrolase [Thermodesulfobacteriota bacterium]
MWAKRRYTKEVEELKAGVFLFNGYVSNPYLITGEKLVTVDVSVPSAAEKIVAFVEKELKRKRTDITLITATHFHIDHIGGIDALRRMTSAHLAFHPLVKEYLTGRRIKFPALKKWVMGIIPAWRTHAFSLPSVRDIVKAPIAGYPVLKSRISSTVEVWLGDDAPLPENPEWRVIFTPGHSDDSICLYNQNNEILLSGDTVLNVTGRGELNPFNSDEEAIFRSFEILKGLKVKNLYPGHGRPLEKEELWEEVLKLSLHEIGVKGSWV